MVHIVPVVEPSSSPYGRSSIHSNPSNLEPLMSFHVRDDCPPDRVALKHPHRDFYHRLLSSPSYACKCGSSQHPMAEISRWTVVATDGICIMEALDGRGEQPLSASHPRQVGVVSTDFLPPFNLTGGETTIPSLHFERLFRQGSMLEICIVFYGMSLGRKTNATLK